MIELSMRKRCEPGAAWYALLLLCLLPLRGVAGPLDIGDVAPAFALAGSDGSVHRLQNYRGTPVVLAWFPKAFTGG